MISLNSWRHSSRYGNKNRSRYCNPCRTTGTSKPYRKRSEIVKKDLIDRKYKEYTNNRKSYFKKAKIIRRKAPKVKTYGISLLDLEYNAQIAVVPNTDKKRGHNAPDFSLKDFRERLESGECYYCGRRASSKSNSERGRGLGLDRIDNKRGHTQENTLVCCGRCNLVRNFSLTVDEMIEVGGLLKKFDAKKRIV